METPRFSLSPPAHSSSNDNYCVEAPQEKDFVEDQKLRDLTQRHKPLSIAKKNKIYQACLLCRSLPLCPTCQQCPSCCQKSACGRPSATVLAGLALPGCESKGGIHTERRLLTSFQDQTTPVKVTNHCQPLLTSSQKQTSEGIFTGSDSKTSCRKGHGPFFPGVLQPVISGSKTQQQVEAHPRPQSTEFVPSVSLFQNGNPRDHQTLPSKRGVGHIAGFQRRLLSCSHKSKDAEIPQVSSQWPNLSIHCPPFQSRGIRIHQYLDGWLVRAPCRETCKRHTQALLDLCRRLGWIVNMTKSELCPQQVFNFVCYRFDLSQGLVKPTQERWSILSLKINLLLGQQTCSVRQFMSLIGLLTATEKQVVSGCLHMRPIQWHLKKHWHVPEALEKIIPIPRFLHVHLKWWLDPEKVLKGQPLHPLQHALQLFTDASNEGWGDT